MNRLFIMNDETRRYRWPGQVEKTADKLNRLLADAPDSVPRRPEINTKLIDRLIAITGYEPPSSPRTININYTAPEKTQRDWMRDIAVDTHWDEERTVREYARLDAEGKTPRKSRTQDSLSYAQALWNDGLQKGWLRDLEHESVKQDVEEILDYLNENRVKATYNAVAEAIGIHHSNLVQLFPFLGERRPRASWVVNKRDHEPAKYTADQKHPDLDKAVRVVTDAAELRKLLGW
jgi:hypothetical protein